MLKPTFAETWLLAAAAPAARAAIELLAVGGLLVSLCGVGQSDEPEVGKPPPASRPVAPPAAQDGGNVLLEMKRASIKPGAQGARAKTLAGQWRPILIAELSFARQMCPDLPQPHRAQVKAAAEQALLTAVQETITSTAPKWNSPDPNEPTPQSRIRDALSEALREALPADQWARFAAEAQARIKRRQEVVIQIVVEQIDNELYLTSEQCDQISQSLTDHWRNAWEAWISLNPRHIVGTNSLPDVPADVIASYLTADQMRVWEKIPKVHSAVSSSAVNPADLAWWDEQPREAKDANTDVPPP